MQSAQDAKLIETGKCILGTFFLKDQVEFMADAVAADAVEERQRVGDQLLGTGINPEIEALLQTPAGELQQLDGETLIGRLLTAFG